MKRSIGRITYDDNAGEGYLSLNDHFLMEDTLLVADVLKDLVYEIGLAYASAYSNCDVLCKPGCSYAFRYEIVEKEDQPIN